VKPKTAAVRGPSKHTMKNHGYSESDREGMRLNYLRGYHNAMTECARTHPGMDTHPDCPKCKPHRPAYPRRRKKSESESEYETESESEIEIKRAKRKSNKGESKKGKSNDYLVDQFVTPADQYVTAEVTEGPDGEVIETHTTWQPYMTHTYHNGYGCEQNKLMVPASFSQVIPPGHTGGSDVYFRSGNAISNHNEANYNGANHNEANYNGANHNEANYNGANHNVANYNGANHNVANYNGANHNVANYNGANHNVAEWAGHRTGMSQNSVALQNSASSMEHQKARIVSSQIQSSAVKPISSTVVKDSSSAYQLAANQIPVNQWNSQYSTGQIQSSAVRPINSTLVSSNKYLTGHTASTNHYGSSHLSGNNLKVMKNSMVNPINTSQLDSSSGNHQSQIVRHNYATNYLNTVNATGLDSSSRIYQSQVGPANYSQNYLNTVNAAGLDSSSRIYQSQVGPANYTQSYLNMQNQAKNAEPGLGKGSFFKSSVGNHGCNYGHVQSRGNFFICNETLVGGNAVSHFGIPAEHGVHWD
jgi:hypothetical protein